MAPHYSVYHAGLLQLIPTLFARTASENYAVSFRGSNTSTAPIRTLRKHVHTPGHEWDGQNVLIAVNIDRACNACIITAKFDITDPSDAEYGSVQAPFENRGVIAVLNGSFIDDFEAMDTQVYLLNKRASDSQASSNADFDMAPSEDAAVISEPRQS